jgi:hypothetical protein
MDPGEKIYRSKTLLSIQYLSKNIPDPPTLIYMVIIF